MEYSQSKLISKPSVGVLIGFVTFGIITVALNGTVLMAIRSVVKQNRTKSKILYILLAYLAVSDLMLGIVKVITKFYCTVQGCGFVECKQTTAVIFWMVYCSMFGIILVAVDRFVFILYGIYYNQWFTTRRVYLAIGASIVVAFCGCGPALIPFFDDDEPEDVCTLVVMSPIELQIYMLVATWLCVAVALILNLVIFHRVIRVVKEITDEERSRHNGNDVAAARQKWAPSKKRAMKFLFFTTGAFFVTYIPPISIVTVQLLCSIDLRKEFGDAAFLIILNSILNPIIYAFWQKDIREVLKKRFACRMKIGGLCTKAPLPVEPVSWRSTGY